VFKRGCFVGRFQPPHWGHFKAIEWILERTEELVVVVGSAQYNYIEKDPFTAGERIWMLREGLKEAGVDLSRVLLMPLDNVENNAIWVRRLLSYMPPIDVAFTNNPFVELLFREHGIVVVNPPLYERDRLKSSLIRNMMLKGDNEWRSLVPSNVAEVIDKIGGINRLRIISIGEVEPHKW